MANIDTYNFNQKKVMVRVDFNVPLNSNSEITDDTRIKAALPTIRKILNDGGLPIIMSHLGRPNPESYSDELRKYSLIHLVNHLANTLNTRVHFSKDCVGPLAENTILNAKFGELVLLENTRFHKEEEDGDETFSKQLAEFGDTYVNDAFGTAHRAHASTAVIAKFFSPENKMFGYLMEAEINNANKVLQKAERPFTAVIGGAKVSDKILIIEKLLDKADNIIIGGGMSYTFFKAKNGQIGNSLCEEDRLGLALELIQKAKEKGVNFLLPEDSIIADQFSNEADTKDCNNMNIPDGWMGLDIGPKAIDEFRETIMNSKTILWNGPMGVFEMQKFQNGTASIANAVADSTTKGAFSLIGGGDSVAAINKFNLANKVSYVSTGGGAMLRLFEGKSLPGVEAIG